MTVNVLDRDSDDRSLLARVAHGDAEALAGLYDRHSRAVYTLAVRIVGDRTEAEDVVQEVFTQAWRQAVRYDSTRATVTGWLLMMTRARSIDHVRARHARPDVGGTQLRDVASTEPGHDAVAVGLERDGRVRHALHQLSEPLREPLELAYYEGMTQAAIAERLGQPLGTVKTRMRTALTHLRTVLHSETDR
jgi:RNA polymerase sigma-70 factor, ECF subfamily